MQLKAVVEVVKVEVFNHQIEGLPDHLRLEDAKVVGNGHEKNTQQEVPAIFKEVFIENG